jgi:DNA-binding LytR/AlgR family response regulator
MTLPAPTALIAEDEPLLARALAAELQRAWPGLQLLPTAPDGEEAVAQALAALPDLLFLDIRMPGQTGLEAAQAIVEDWPAERPLPLIVFVTAYDQYALQAFEASAVDYVLKPVQAERLAATCRRLQACWPSGARRPARPRGEDAALVERLRQLLGGRAAPPRRPVRRCS